MPPQNAFGKGKKAAQAPVMEERSIFDDLPAYNNSKKKKSAKK